MMLMNLPKAFSLLGDYSEPYAWFPESASSFSEINDSLYYWITITCMVFFVPIVIALFYFAVKYNKPKGTKAESNVAHNTVLEVTWSIVPSFFLVGMFIFGAKAFLEMRDVPDGANEINVQAFKWGWTIDYGSGVFHPELHILKDEPVKLSMRSTDVIHSLYIPAFRAKKDIVPGRYNYMWFKPTVASEKVSDEELAAAIKQTKDLGESWNFDEHQFTPDGYRFYDLYCAEYCGTNHSEMQTVVVVHETLEDLNAWIKQYSKRDASVPPAEYGEKLYKNRGCAGCHSIDGTKRVGPSFAELYGRPEEMITGDKINADENYIRESILYPKAQVVAGYQPVMPSYKGQLSDDDIYSLIEYMKTLAKDGGAAK
ncbi:Cytochrome c oxidase subunit 2 precursor [Rubripirellula lacrimiformis]|uniref:Cytochrome c oxidase subunit 2 n=1 Tax=Rubripirellula lacrimiformis TaxID=1930273 RepID=A0A517NHW1_9BACT|nr:cytochrome c oxidase subunit II [Rubripirellula lacrimiformis]QDT06726.1 Cytochrome c oxidase subunit 2 precursor [Rubripirellula lacrimiformis]